MSFFSEMFSSKDNVSHKRVIAVLGFITLLIFMCITKNEESIKAVKLITLAMTTGSVAEKFSKRFNKSI